METFTYSNRYGKIEARQVTDWFEVGKFSSRRFLLEHPEHPTFNVDTAEQIVLITDNRQSQVAGMCYVDEETDKLIWTSDSCILLVHQSASIACVVEITALEYCGPNAQEEIAMYARIDSYKAHLYSY